jgi:hypothetical protein
MVFMQQKLLSALRATIILLKITPREQARGYAVGHDENAPTGRRFHARAALASRCSLMPARFIGAKLRRNVFRVLAAEPAQALAIKLTLLETWVCAVHRTQERTRLQTPRIVLSPRDAHRAT